MLSSLPLRSRLYYDIREKNKADVEKYDAVTYKSGGF